MPSDGRKRRCKAVIILSDCLTETADEGALKVASSLARRLRQLDDHTLVITYDRKPSWSDMHLALNRLFLNRSLLKVLRRRHDPVLYIPFASNTLASALRVCVLSLMGHRQVRVLFALRHPMNGLTRRLLKWSGAEIITLSEASLRYFQQETGHALQLKAGVDTKKFTPVNAGKKAELRQKYGVAPDQKVLLHVGHLNAGRNVQSLLHAGEEYHVFLVVSTVTQVDEALRRRLEERPNTTIIDHYLPDVHQLYQMADVYLFPVMEEEHCIDLPLSVMEAASCNVPIVTTAYGELAAFQCEPGFAFISGNNGEEITDALSRMAAMRGCENRAAIREYDWDRAVAQLLRMT
ncbi:MAG: glycosyltransferase family 4 protein [Clostridiales bacterium]|nr:glycosyltransferase family 4 protein [Clostridiales bacterium]